MTKIEWDLLVESGSDDDLMYALTDLPDDDLVEFVRYADAEICNGGFFQYFSNGIFDANKHKQFLIDIGLYDLAQVIQDSLDVFPDGVQPIRLPDCIEPIDDKVLELVREKGRFDEFDKQYYAKNSQIEPAMANWVRKNSNHYWELISDI